jgi:hypothetical protein
MSKVHTAARAEFRLLAESLTGVIREAAAASGLHVAERRRRLELLLYAVPLEVLSTLIATLLELGAAGPFDPELNSVAADASHRQLAAVGTAWRLYTLAADVDSAAEQVYTGAPGEVADPAAGAARIDATTWPAADAVPLDDLADVVQVWPALDPDHMAPAAPGRTGGPVLPPPMADPASTGDVYRLVALGVDAGLCAPVSMSCSALQEVRMQVPSGAQSSVEHWAALFGVDRPTLSDDVLTSDGWCWRNYGTDNGPRQVWRGWSVNVRCAVDVPETRGACVDPGDQEHDHEMCHDVAQEALDDLAVEQPADGGVAA